MAKSRPPVPKSTPTPAPSATGGPGWFVRPQPEDLPAIIGVPQAGVLVLDDARRRIIAVNETLAQWLPEEVRPALRSESPLHIIDPAHHGDFLDVGVGDAPQEPRRIQLTDGGPWFTVEGSATINAAGEGRWVYWILPIVEPSAIETDLRQRLDEQRARAQEAVRTSLGVYQITEKIRRAPRLSALLLGVRSEKELFSRVGSFLQSEAIHAEFVRILTNDRSGVLRTVYSSCDGCEEAERSPNGERIEVLERLIDEPGESRWVPLVRREQVVGVIELRLPKIEERRLAEVPLIADWLEESLNTLAEMIALFHENLELYQVLESQARHDGLTGLHNRHDLREELDRDVGRASRENSALSLIFIDLDHFKTLNDSFGHAIGDRVLTRFAVLLEDSFRESDYLCRYGGDEFVVILPATGGTEALAKSQRLVERVRTEFRDDDWALTLSVGVAEWNRQETGRELLRRADEAMYRAKRDGRDRTCLIPSEVELPREIIGSTVIRKRRKNSGGEPPAATDPRA